MRAGRLGESRGHAEPQGAVKYRFCPSCRREYGAKLGAIQREYSHKMRMLCGNDALDAMKEERRRRRELMEVEVDD